MKRMKSPLLRSKSALLSVCVAGIFLAVPACKKDDDKKTIDASEVTVSQASDVVADAIVSPENGGVMVQTTSALQIANAFMNVRKGAKTDDCGYSNQGNLDLKSDANSAVTFSYNFKYSWELKCASDSESYQSFAFDFSGRTQVSTAKFSSNDSSAAIYKITGLDDASEYFLINQTFDHSGELVSKVSSMASLSSVIKYTAYDIKINKSTLQIVSGTATVKISGKSSEGKAFSYEGTITFKGNNKAVLVLGSSTTDLKW